MRTTTKQQTVVFQPNIIKCTHHHYYCSTSKQEYRRIASAAVADLIYRSSLTIVRIYCGLLLHPIRKIWFQASESSWIVFSFTLAIQMAVTVRACVEKTSANQRFRFGLNSLFFINSILQHCIDHYGICCKRSPRIFYNFLCAMS